MLWMRGILIALLAAHTVVSLAEPQPATAAAEVAPDGATAAADHFDIFEFQVEGNSVLPSLVIEETVYPFMGEKKILQASRWRARSFGEGLP